jgi:hypothetical protein
MIVGAIDQARQAAMRFSKIGKAGRYIVLAVSI